ncbi:MAG: carboxypeptidase-like regulatory domain-containing protein, partial [Planctomycetota bacterium]
MAALVVTFGLAAQQPATPESATVQVRGRVLDANGQPLPKAGVAVSTDPEFTTATALTKPRARCAADGTFELTLDRAPGVYGSALLIAAPGKVAFELPNLEAVLFTQSSRHPERIDFGDVCLPDGFTLTGRVRGSDGKPLAGARIHATDCLSPYAWLAAGYASRAISNERGVFVLAGVFGQAMNVTVNADGCYERRLPCVDLAQPLDVQLDASGFVEGTLLDEEGKPANGVVAAAYEFLGSYGAPRPVAVVGGKWRLPVTLPCRLFVQANRAGTKGGWWGGAAASSELLSGPTQGVELRFAADPKKSFVVRAVDGGGARVTPIRAAWLDEGMAEQVEEQLQFYVIPSGADGAVTVKQQFGRGGSGTVVVLAEGFAPFQGKQVAWQEGGSYEAKMVPECRIAGRVLDAATGKPFAGALVTCDRVRPKPGQGGGPKPRPIPVVTSADGSFAWRGLGALPCVVTARHPDGTVVATQRLKWKGPGEQQEVTLSLAAGVTVSGKLTGAPLPRRWRVQLAPPPPTEPDGWSFDDSGLAMDLADTTTLDDGAFRFAHRAEGFDDLTLVVPLPPRQGPALRVPLDKVRTRKEGDEVVDVDVGKRLPGAIAGKVTLRGADFPVGRLAVVAVRSVAGEQGWINPGEQLRRRSWQLAVADGAFRIPAIAGKYTLQAIDVATGVVLFRSAEEFEVAAGAVRQQELAVEVVEVQVRCEAEDKNRKQLGAERVEVQTVDDAREWEMTLFGGGPHGTPGAGLDATGSARLFLRPGTFRLRVGVGAQPTEGTFTWGSEPAAEETIEAVLGQVSEVRLRLPAPAD